MGLTEDLYLHHVDRDEPSPLCPDCREPEPPEFGADVLWTCDRCAWRACSACAVDRAQVVRHECERRAA